MPNMHARGVENIPEGAPGDIQVAVIEVADHGREDSNPQDDVARDAKYNEGKIGERLVDDDLHPMESEVSDPVEFLD